MTEQEKAQRFENAIATQIGGLVLQVQRQLVELEALKAEKAALMEAAKPKAKVDASKTP